MISQRGLKAIGKFFWVIVVFAIMGYAKVHKKMGWDKPKVYNPYEGLTLQERTKKQLELVKWQIERDKKKAEQAK